MAYSHIFFIKVNFLLFQRLVVRRTSVFFARRNIFTPSMELKDELQATKIAKNYQMQHFFCKSCWYRK